MQQNNVAKYQISLLSQEIQVPSSFPHEHHTLVCHQPSAHKKFVLCSYTFGTCTAKIENMYTHKKTEIVT